MIIKSTKFVGSFPSLKLCPAADRPEYAFIGRSNVGKSSLINMITGVSGLARTSGEPGKTQTLNYFDINSQWYLVDLPGYGYAKTPKKLRKEWRKMIEEYLAMRETLQCAFLLIDSCISPQDVDLQFADWMGENNVPFVIAFTKTDRKKAKQNEDYLESFQTAFLKHWDTFPTYFITSAEKREGRDDLLAFIDGVNTQFHSAKDV